MSQHSKKRAFSAALLSLVTMLGLFTLMSAPAHGAPPLECTEKTNPNNVATADNTTVGSPITYTQQCRGREASAATTVNVSGQHDYCDSLLLSLKAPDGTVYNLGKAGGIVPCNFNLSFRVNLSSEQIPGTWTMQATDTDSFGDTGFIDSWSMNPTAAVPTR